MLTEQERISSLSDAVSLGAQTFLFAALGPEAVTVLLGVQLGKLSVLAFSHVCLKPVKVESSLLPRTGTECRVPQGDLEATGKGSEGR